MKQTISVEGDATFHSVMADLALDFAAAPIHRIGFEIDEAAIELLAGRYPERVFRTRQWSTPDRLTWRTLLLRFDGGAYVLARNDGHRWLEVTAPRREAALAIARELRELLKEHASGRRPAFYMLRCACQEFEVDPIDNLPEPVEQDLLRLCYGDDIVAWITQFNEKTRNRPGGLTILEGPPGTGKTSLLMQMIRELEKTHLFYVLPVAQDSALSSPELVPFWQGQNAEHADRVKVIVMEDAERLLWRRDGDNREAVSSLLNIADGLMGRMLKLHIICSINARMQDLDPAILRPGRLMNHRRFKLLSRAVAERIALKKKTTFLPGPERSEYSLADVLNPGVKAPAMEKRPIGFQDPMTV